MIKVPFNDLKTIHEALLPEMIAAFDEFLQSGRYILGDAVLKFEEEYASFTGTKYCVGVGSGLDALILSLKALDIGPDDDVIVPTNTYVATWVAVSRVGARVIPVEPDPTTMNISAEGITQAITKNTRAIIPVHLYGLACPMSDIRRLANEHGIFVIEDNAQAHGARHQGDRTGSFGHINAHSFYPTKNLGALGDAGAITTDDPELAEKVRLLRNYGSREKYINEVIGYNTRIDALQSKLLSIKLPRLENWNRERRILAGRYTDALQQFNSIALPPSSPEVDHVYHLYVIRTGARDSLQNFLLKKGIETLIHYPVPPHLQPAYHYLGHRPGDFPVAEELSVQCLSLPLFVGMRDEQQTAVIEAIRAFFR